MSDKSGIEWTDATWNPIRGTKGRHHCVRISEGCKHCYAAAMNHRFRGPDYVKGADVPRLDEERVLGPLHCGPVRGGWGGVLCQAVGDEATRPGQRAIRRLRRKFAPSESHRPQGRRPSGVACGSSGAAIPWRWGISGGRVRRLRSLPGMDLPKAVAAEATLFPEKVTK